MTTLRAAEGVAALCLEFAVLCAARTSEALLPKWVDFDLDAATWTLPKEHMKAGPEFTFEVQHPPERPGRERAS